MRLSVGHPVRGCTAGSALMRRTARLRTWVHVAGLFAPGSITGLCVMGGTVFSKLPAICARLENLLTVAPAKIELPLIARAICAAGEPLSHVRIVVSYASAVLRIVLPMRHVGATVDVDLPSAPVDVSTPKSSTRGPARERVASAKGNSRSNDAAGEITILRVVIVGGIVGIWPRAIDDCRIIKGHVDGAGVRGLDGDDLSATLLPDRHLLFFGGS